MKIVGFTMVECQRVIAGFTSMTMMSRFSM